MDQHAVSEDRVVNIDETSCRLLPVHQIGWTAVASNKLSHRATRGRPRHSQSPSAWIVAPWTCWCELCTRARRTPSCRSSPGPERTRHVTSVNGWATTTTLLQLTSALDDVMNLGKEVQSWILLWDMASIHASEGTVTAMRRSLTSCCASSRRTARRTYSPATWPSSGTFKSCIRTQASTTLARSVVDGPFDDFAMRQSTEWASRAVTDFDENKARTTGWRPLRARSDGDFREAVCESNQTRSPHASTA